MGGNRQDLISSMDKPKKYKIVLSKDALQDIKNIKTYILETFKYRVYAENFSKKIKAAIKALDPFAEGYEKTRFTIEGLEVYYKPYSTYLIFFVVEDAIVTVIRILKDRMYWQAIINRMKKIDK
ncbi:MAG: type II toxin-antitoxin system RelE/ParE family toxin [Lachnospiraceae bacterium]